MRAPTTRKLRRPTVAPRLAGGLALAALLALAGCAAHDKAGDKAAAVGDWKTAYVEYRQAVADDEKNPALRARFEEARAKALDLSGRQARACAAQGQWDCALAEADFALSIEPGQAELAGLRRDAARSVALERVRQAEGETSRGGLTQARNLLAEARRLSSDRAVDEAARAAERRWTVAAAAEAEKLRAARRFPEAVGLLETAAGFDPSLRPQLERAQREWAAFRDAEFNRLMAEGDRALASGAFTEAASRFRAAQASRPDERAKGMERYANLCAQGEQAIARGDFGQAERTYREAAGLRVDRGFAEAQLGRVAVRPWAVTVRGVLIDPVRPDGTPWIGPPSARLNSVARTLAALGPGVDARVLRAANDVPRDNRPALVVEVVYPDGRRLASAPYDGPFFTADATFILAANGFDQRRVTLRVLHQERSRPATLVGEVHLPVGELLSRPFSALAQAPLLAVELSVTPSDGAPEGAARGFAPVVEPPRPPPPPATTKPPAPKPPPPPKK